MNRFVIATILALGGLLSQITPVGGESPYPGCKSYPIGPNSPTGIVGCEVYGEGVASWYHGTGVARNDCVYPWKNCQTISITSLDTGITIIETPVTYCDCYTGTSRERIVDLSPDEVSALGLNLSAGLFRVDVEPYFGDGVSNTAMGGGN